MPKSAPCPRPHSISPGPTTASRWPPLPLCSTDSALAEKPMLPKILVVDDTPANLVAMRRLLAGCGAPMIEATSGNEALALCLDHRFPLILLDVNMPDMDGFEVVQLLAETDQLRDTPVIFVTAAHGE